MGFHVCEACTGQNPKHRFGYTSSGDVTLIFENGRRWVMPDMILHYVADHRWQPPIDFINDVMSGTLQSSGRRQTRSTNASETIRVGYLEGAIPDGIVPVGFIDKLAALMKEAGYAGMRRQTKAMR